MRHYFRVPMTALALAMTVATLQSGLAQTPAPGSNPPAGNAMPMGMMGKHGQAGMMNSDTGQMMGMMRNMMGMMSAQSGMMSSHVEGRIASLKTDLKITDAQTEKWNHFAEALRGTGKSMNDMHQQMMSQTDAATSLPARLELREKMMTAHLASLKTLEEALAPLYASFSDEQKKVADGMMIGPMGMM